MRQFNFYINTMPTQKLINTVKEIIKQEKKELKEIEARLGQQEVDIKNVAFFKYLSKSIAKREKINTYEVKLKELNKRKRTQMFINAQSKVKLVSTKVGAIVWVDAVNYIELVGRKVGDVITMHNSQFKIAGIY